MNQASPVIAITLDIDWAPDFVIDHVAEILLRQEVKCTWFVTHASAAIDRLREHPEMFELGLHPNFLPGSSQGRTPQDILSFCRDCVPEARSIRTHSLVQSTPLLEMFMLEGGIERDVSLFLPYHAGLRPFRYRLRGCEFWRFPYFWEDDIEMEQVEVDWNLPRLLGDGSPLAIFDFHPIHIYLNSPSMAAYDVMKLKIGRLSDAPRDQVDPYVQKDPGAGTAFRGLVDYLARQPGTSRLIREIPVPMEAGLPE